MYGKFFICFLSVLSRSKWVGLPPWTREVIALSTVSHVPLRTFTSEAVSFQTSFTKCSGVPLASLPTAGVAPHVLDKIRNLAGPLCSQQCYRTHPPRTEHEWFSLDRSGRDQQDNSLRRWVETISAGAMMIPHQDTFSLLANLSDSSAPEVVLFCS